MTKLLRKIDGYVWCDRHCCIHDEGFDPFGYMDENEMCQPEEHRSVFGKFEKDELP